MKIICIGRNYVEHAKELGNEVPDEPVIFLKPQTALKPISKPIHYPEFTNELHYECELVLKVCKNGKYLSRRAALECFNEITVGIDFTARDIQNKLKEKGLPWEKAKAFDGAAIIGSWKKIQDHQKKEPIHFHLDLNNKTVQEGNTENMIFNFAKIIEDASKYFTLNIGDLIFTGTPAGVGECVAGDNLKGFYENECLFDFTIQ